MKNDLNWKKGAFSTTYQIFSGEEFVGELQDHIFKQTSDGTIHQKRYRFKTTGWFRQETRIIDRDSEREIGTITYNSWKSKATIQFTDRTIYWKYDNGLQTIWSLYDEKGTRMKFAGRFSKGTIECKEADALLVLTGMFVTNYFQQAMVVIFMAIFIPIWASVIN